MQMVKRTLHSRLLTGLVLSLLLVPSVSCKRTFVDDLFDIHEQIDALKASHEDLKRRLDNLNESIVTIQAIVDVLNSGYYVERIDPLLEDGKEAGYTFHFTNGRSIIIRHGQDALDGHSPVVGVTVVDGKYYWTLDGNLLLDEGGNKVPVLSETFISPLFSISNGYWYLSFDGGDTWTLLGQATGEDGAYGRDGIEHFIRVDISSDEVAVFVLADGTVLTIPRRQGIRLVFESGDDAVPIGERETIRIPYRLTAATENTVVNVSSDGYYTAKVIPTDKQSGVISITCPRTYSDGFVNVLVFENAGIVDTHLISFYEKKMTFSDGLEFEVAPGGGTVTVPYAVNFPYHLEIDPEAKGWLTVGNSGGGTPSEGNIVITAAANDGVSRTGAVYIIPDNGEQVYAAIFITQQSLHCTIEKGSFLLSYEGGTVLCGLTTDLQFQTSIPDTDREWLKAEVLYHGEKRYSIAITAEPNPKAESRSSVIDIVTSPELQKIATIRILQNGRNLDLEYAMVFIVNPNYSNDFTAYLPIDINSSFDCFVDWGDGTGQRYRTEDDFNALPEEERNIHHRYERLGIGRTFEVVVSGTVTSLNADVIPRAFRSSVTEVKQWGKTGLVRMYRAFDGFAGLTTLHLDETGAFENVESFDYSFAECPRLTTISEHLFDHAQSATSFRGTFMQCNSLAIIPENLFRQTTSARYFDETFAYCNSLVTLPEHLFAHCSEATSFSQTFHHCESLQNVPAGLFSGNPAVESFSHLFGECHSLSRIPQGLFDHNPEAVDFSWSFWDCHSLVDVPASLLDHQLKITHCDYMFVNCDNLRSESPWTLVDGQRIHLYERYLYPDLFVTPWWHEYCFGSCWNMPDFSQVPDFWK